MPANCPHPAVPATFSPREKERMPRRVCNSTVKRANEVCTPRIVAVARQLKFRAVVLAVWDPRSAAELDGVAELACLYHKELALGVLVGNEGITFSRYELEDLTIAADRLRRKLPSTVPLSTCEPLPAYSRTSLLDFGDFLAPNIHPVFDRPQLGPGD